MRNSVRSSPELIFGRAGRRLQARGQAALYNTIKSCLGQVVGSCVSFSANALIRDGHVAMLLLYLILQRTNLLLQDQGKHV